MIRSFSDKIISALINSRPIRKIGWLKYLKDKSGFLRELYYNHKTLGSSVAIENTTACNRACPYCPHFWNDRGSHLMPESVFRKIIGDLRDLDYRGLIIFAPWSEPLLDDRLAAFVAYAKDHLPKSRVAILTNGDLLTGVKFRELIAAGVDMIDVSDHYTIRDDRYQIDAPKQAIATYRRLDENDRKKLHFHDPNYKKIRGLERFNNRSGLVPLRECVSVENLCRTCVFPETIMAINFRGNILLCARQWREDPVYGNVVTEHLRDIWQKAAFVRARSALRKGIFELDLCRNCGYGYPLEPGEVTAVRAARSGGPEA